MFYVNSRRTLTRRESSLISSRSKHHSADKTTSTPRTCIKPPESEPPEPKPPGSVEKELVTCFFESMLDHTVKSWTVLETKPEPILIKPDAEKAPSEILDGKKKKPGERRSKQLSARSLTKVSQTAMDPIPAAICKPPNEKVIIQFKNGNVYEGNVSHKCFHGEGRFQWSNGTVYLGEFHDNQIKGKGTLFWKDDTWYEGEFTGNMRHGKGLYVDSRRQRSYSGEWYMGHKHGKGAIYYDKTFKNNYDGDWEMNVRHGYGSREYCPHSGYKGEWDRYIREGKGLMIWPNNDIYMGFWKSGIMSGQGTYTWNTTYTNCLAIPCFTRYQGQWLGGKRNGEGKIDFGFGYGAHYQGEFKNNRKDGIGTVVTKSGFVERKLFVDDVMKPAPRLSAEIINIDEEETANLFDSRFDHYMYHIDHAYETIIRQAKIRSAIIDEYLENNNDHQHHHNHHHHQSNHSLGHRTRRLTHITKDELKTLKEFENISLRKAISCYEVYIKRIYNKYALILSNDNIDEVHSFIPVLIRLQMWQFYWDCNIHQKGLTLVEIDNMFHSNKDWLTKTSHGPFEPIYYWQFLHCLILVACRLYAKKELPGLRPNTVVAQAFRKFFTEDVLPGTAECSGRLTQGYASFIPLKGLYELYRSLGEPHTVRTFINAVRRSPHTDDSPEPEISEYPDECVPMGRNVYIFGEHLTFVTDENLHLPQLKDYEENNELRLFNFADLSTKKILKIFSDIFPQMIQDNKILDVNIELTFLEFFEAFVNCALESVNVKDEEPELREMFSE